MTTPGHEQLAAIRSFPSLVKYLRDDLDCPIESEDVDDLTIDYSPEELGLEVRAAPADMRASPAADPRHRRLRGLPADRQVCQKWLNDRNGRVLSPDDIGHYHRIVVGLSETIRLMAQIGQTIDARGGWAGAFEASAVGPTPPTGLTRGIPERA